MKVRSMAGALTTRVIVYCILCSTFPHEPSGGVMLLVENDEADAAPTDFRLTDRAREKYAVLVIDLDIFVESFDDLAKGIVWRNV